MRLGHRWRRRDVGHFRLLIDELTRGPSRMAGEVRGRRSSRSAGKVGWRTGQIDAAYGSLALKSPSIEVSALVASAIITLVSGEWWRWVPVMAAILVVHVLRRR
jgi:hypothetical protein